MTLQYFITNSFYKFWINSICQMSWSRKIKRYRQFSALTLTCRTVKIVTNMITITEQIATATTPTNVTGDLIWSIVLALSASVIKLPPPSMRAASLLLLLNKFPSSVSCDNCFSAAMRRFPAGDEFMQSPVFEIKKITSRDL